MLLNTMRCCSTFTVPLLLALCVAVPRASAQTGEYVIGPQDVLTITVWERAELSGKFDVEADGTISYPLIGRTRVGGLTVQAAENRLKKLLADGYLKNPLLAIAVDEYRSQQIFVMGEVRTPGGYPFTGELTVLAALARAGGTTPTAGSEAVIVRATGADRAAPRLPDAAADRSQLTHLDLDQLQRRGGLGGIELRPGDTIFVPRADTVFVSGQVVRPGEYPFRTGTTVRQAISLAGGVTDRGSTRRLRVVRTADGRETELDIKLQDVVQPGDTIIVRERLF